MLKVLGAVRLSRLTDESTSPVRQRERIDWWVSGQNARVVHVSEDLDVSGSVDPFDREGLGPWLTDNPPEEWDTLVAWKLDRISRSALDTLKLLEWCIQRNKRIVCVDDGIDSATQMGRVWVQLASIFAEVERTNIAERTLKGKAALRSTGRWTGEAVHYGYQAVKYRDGWYLELDSEAVKVILGVIKKVHEGHSIQGIADYLTDAGIPTPRDRQRILRGEEPKGKAWNGQTLFKLLSSKTLLGYTSHKGEIDTEVLKAPPILSTAEFQALQEEVSQRRNGKKVNRSTDASPLSGIAVCYNCGEKLYHRGQTVDGTLYRYYHCRWNRCTQSIKAEHLEQILEDEFLAQVGDAEVYEDVFVPGSDVSTELESATFALEELSQAMSRASSRAARQSLTERINSLDERIAELEQLPQEPARWERRSTGRTYAQQWESSDTQQRRKLIVAAGIRLQAKHEGRGRAAHQHGMLRFHLNVPQDILDRL